MIFSKQDYVIIKNFLNPEEISYQSNALRQVEKSCFMRDEQVPDVTFAYNYLPQLEVLCNKLHIVSNAVEELLLPTYCYCRIYKNGSELLPHLDRKSSEIAVSIHLYGDQEWPLFIKTRDKKSVGINLLPGQAVVYQGGINRHWRKPYKGIEFGQFFLFYVRSRGEYASEYFDNLRAGTMNLIKIADQGQKDLLKNTDDPK